MSTTEHQPTDWQTAEAAVVAVFEHLTAPVRAFAARLAELEQQRTARWRRQIQRRHGRLYRAAPRRDRARGAYPRRWGWREHRRRSLAARQQTARQRARRRYRRPAR